MVEAFLEAGAVEGRRSLKRTLPQTGRGTPQGGVLSPLLANLYVTRLDYTVNGQKVFHAKTVRYADDFVILMLPQHIGGHPWSGWPYGLRGMTCNSTRAKGIG